MSVARIPSLRPRLPAVPPGGPRRRAAYTTPPPLEKQSGLRICRPLLVAAGSVALLLVAMAALSAWVSADPREVTRANVPTAPIAVAQAIVPQPEDKPELAGREVLPAAQPPTFADEDPFQARQEAAPGPDDEPPAAPPRRGCQTFGTAIDFAASPAEAAGRAEKEYKLLFVLHISGNFEDDKFT